jgi:hypothetical protein
LELAQRGEERRAVQQRRKHRHEGGALPASHRSQ